MTNNGEGINPRWTERGSPAYRRINAALFIAGLAIFSLLYCVQPLLPVLSADFGIDAAQASLSVSLATGCLAFAILIAGGLSDRFGRKGVMAASLVGAALINIAIAFVPNWPMLLLGRALEGVALGGAPAIAMAYLAEEIHPRSLGFAMGLYVGGTAIGGMAGRIVTGVVAQHFGWRAAVGTVGVLGLCLAIGFAVLLPLSRNFTLEPRGGLRLQVRGLSQLVARPGLAWLFLCGALLMGGFVTLYNYAAFRLQAPPYALSQGQSSLVFSLYALGTLAATLAGVAADRVGRAPVMAASLALSAIGLWLTLAAALWTIVLGIALFTLGFFAGHGVASGWVGRLAGSSKGKAASLYLLSYYLGSSLLGSLGGLFWSAAGWPALAGFIAALLAVLGLAIARLWHLAPQLGTP